MVFMTESGTRVEKAELDIDKLQAILDKIEQVLQAVAKLEAAPKGTRALRRAAIVAIVGAVAALGTATVMSRRTSSSNPASTIAPSHVAASAT